MTFKNYFLVAVGLSLITTVGIFITKSFLPPLVPLFYGKPTGAEQLASTWFIFVIPGISILITVINMLINLATRDEFIQKIVAVASFLIAVMASITVVKIILLVGFF